MNHSEITIHFASRASTKDVRGHNIYTRNDNKDIYSYGLHFRMAHANDETKTIVVNGDAYSTTTSRHQSYLRSALANNMPSGYRSIIVPFTISAANRANFKLESIDIIDVSPDREIAKCLTHNADFSAIRSRSSNAWDNLNAHRREYNYECDTKYFHRLGESVFRAEDYTTGKWSYFLSGFDETASSNTTGYFISKLPRRATSVEDAFLSLAPKSVQKAIAEGLEVKRQGDTFAIPATNILTRKVKNKQKSGLVTKAFWGATYNTREYPMLNDSHAATEIGYVNKVMYARGSLIHRPANRRPEHKRIKLGNVWHKIVFNTALGSWSTSGRVD